MEAQYKFLLMLAMTTIVSLETLVGFACSANMLEFSDDLLWDGQQCGGVEAPCCTHPNIPWFIKTLNETTTEVIELRACSTSSVCGSGAALSLIEIYVR